MGHCFTFLGSLQDNRTTVVCFNATVHMSLVWTLDWNHNPCPCDEWAQLIWYNSLNYTQLICDACDTWSVLSVTSVFSGLVRCCLSQDRCPTTTSENTEYQGVKLYFDVMQLSWWVQTQAHVPFTQPVISSGNPWPTHNFLLLQWGQLAWVSLNNSGRKMGTMNPCAGLQCSEIACGHLSFWTQ